MPSMLSSIVIPIGQPYKWLLLSCEYVLPTLIMHEGKYEHAF